MHFGGFFDDSSSEYHYGNKNEQRAINMAFDILQVYYHSKELCVSDSIYDLDWDIFQIWLILRPNKFSGLIE